LIGSRRGDYKEVISFLLPQSFLSQKQSVMSFRVFDVINVESSGERGKTPLSGGSFRKRSAIDGNFIVVDR